MSDGYGSIFKREVQAKYSDVSVLSAGFADINGANFVRKLDSLLSSASPAPTKAIVSMGVELLDVASVSQLRYEVESIVARLMADNMEVILCPVAIVSERPDLPHEKADILFEFNQMHKQIARDYDVMFVNLTPQFTQYWFRNNVDGLSHSVLTLDGTILNAHGHTFVAMALLKALGVENHSLVSDNIVRQEELRIHAMMNEEKRVSEVDSFLEQSPSAMNVAV
eukprot:CAMPEP_0170444890 /NCGR_PEP_ID=MMETSP0117_2-20130122/48771_1 /TAXON_ID=400756 /ORGANISM="Durinskia baltica, Strain CSIRO CS-38" /LENGTH=223 /DNA_ID=CAMNT_0010705733 /DNA_START=173 /DNA_END=840 /DNA_ORIENTATION=-